MRCFIGFSSCKCCLDGLFLSGLTRVVSGFKVFAWGCSCAEYPKQFVYLALASAPVSRTDYDTMFFGSRGSGLRALKRRGMELLSPHKETKLSRHTPTAPSLLLRIESSKTLNPKPSLQGFGSRARVQSFRMSGAFCSAGMRFLRAFWALYKPRSPSPNAHRSEPLPARPGTSCFGV